MHPISFGFGLRTPMAHGALPGTAIPERCRALRMAEPQRHGHRPICKFDPYAAVYGALQDARVLSSRHVTNGYHDVTQDVIDLDALRESYLQQAEGSPTMNDMFDAASRRRQLATAIGLAYDATRHTGPTAALERAYLFLDALARETPDALDHFIPFALTKSVDDAPVSAWPVTVMFDRVARFDTSCGTHHRVQTVEAFCRDVFARRHDVVLIHPGQPRPVMAFDHCRTENDVKRLLSDAFLHSRSPQEIQQYLPMWRVTELAPHRPDTTHAEGHPRWHTELIGRWHTPPTDSGAAAPARLSAATWGHHAAAVIHTQTPAMFAQLPPLPPYSVASPDDRPRYPTISQVQSHPVLQADPLGARAMTLAFSRLRSMHEHEGNTLALVEHWRGQPGTGQGLTHLRQTYALEHIRLHAGAQPSALAQCQREWADTVSRQYVQWAGRRTLEGASEEACLIALDTIVNDAPAIAQRCVILAMTQALPGKAEDAFIPLRLCLLLYGPCVPAFSRHDTMPMSVRQWSEWMAARDDTSVLINPAGPRVLIDFPRSADARQRADTVHSILQDAGIDTAIWPVSIEIFDPRQL